MKVLVTGASGYIGPWVVKALLDNGHEVVAIGSNESRIDNRATKYSIDIFDEKNNSLINDMMSKSDAIVHLAWKDGFKHNSDAHRDNLSNHCRFIDMAIQNKVRNLGVIGTMHEVGYHEGGIDEQTVCRPTNPYGWAKNSLREYALLKTKGTNTNLQWMRCYYIYGDDENSKSVFGKVLQAARNGQKTFPFVTGEKKYDFIHVRDLGKQIAGVVVSDMSGILNCCSGKAVSLREQMEKFIKENNLTIKLEIGKFPDRPSDSPITYGQPIQRILEIAFQKTR